MGREDQRRRTGGVPRPNELAEGSPLPNVLRGFAPPNTSAGIGAKRAADDRAAERSVAGSRRRPPREPADGPRRLPGCGCGGWLGLVALLALALRLAGAFGEQTAVTPEATAPAATGHLVEAMELEAGQCFEWLGSETQVDQVRVLECAAAHDAEVSALVTLLDPPGTPYDDQRLQAVSQVQCNAAFTRYTGAPDVSSVGRSSSFIYPGPEGWDAGDRMVICLVLGDAPGALVGPVRDVTD